MRRKTLADHTTQKNQRIFPPAQTAASFVCHTQSALLAVTTRDKLSLPKQERASVNSRPSEERNGLPCRIGVDLMGNENVPEELLSALKKTPSLREARLTVIAPLSLEKEASPYDFVPAEEVIELDENPLVSLRRKKNASTCIGLRLLKEGKIDAFVSAGNTGALVLAAKMILSNLPGILRPALITLMPTKKNPVAVLDVGGNVQVKAANLLQFALIGAAYQQARGILNPLVGLLNIGSEPLKGTSELRLAYQALKKQSGPFNFVGNIEGKSVFDGEVDVLVTDGFSGNIFLKTAEGIANLMLDQLQPSQEQMKKFQSLHYTEYPGALLAGVKGIVIKCHSYSTPKAFIKAVTGAMELVNENFIQVLQDKIQNRVP
jgi:glycerol-3-phosphate acyltransferase PlsX